MTIERGEKILESSRKPCCPSLRGPRSSLPNPGRISMVDTTEVLDYRKYPILYIDDEVENLEAFQD